MPATLHPSDQDLPEHALWRSAFADAPVGLAVLAVDPAAPRVTLVAANRAVCDVVGVEAGRLLAGDLDYGARETGELLPLSGDDVRQLALLAGGEVERVRVERRVRHAAGHLVWLELTASALATGDSPTPEVIVQVEDVTERRRVVQALHARRVAAEAVAHSATLDGALAALVGRLGEVLEFEYAAAWTLDRDERVLRCRARWQAQSLGDSAMAALSRAMSFAPGVGLPGKVWQTRRPLAVADLASEPDAPRVEALNADGLHGAVGFPIFVGRDFVGVVELLSAGVRRFDAAFEQALLEIAEDISRLVARKRARERLAGTHELLLVEDNEFIARLVAESLATTDESLRLTHVTRLSEACEVLSESRPACVLVDLTLPDAEGLTAPLALREQAPDVPIVVLSANEDEQIAVDAVKHGAQDYLTKRRVDMESLARSIRYAIERKAAEQQLLDAPLRDRVTKLPTRTLLVDRLHVALGRHAIGGVAVAVVDLDEFRRVNDSLGHEVGDRLLAETARRLQSLVGDRRTLASLGGDRFAILVEEDDSAVAAAHLAARARDVVAEPYRLGGGELRLTATVGIGLDRLDRPTSERVLSDAETAVSRGKDLGGDRCEVFAEELRRDLRERLRLESELCAAADAGELRVHFQPLVSLDDGSTLAFEALVRWQHPERGLLAPGAFIDVAEQTGLVVPIGEWVLREACVQFAAWRRETPAAAAIELNVNLSARQLSDPGLVAAAVAAAAAARVEPRLVCLEVTETALMEDPDASVAVLRALRDAGFRIALDDFGTGYSSLGYLQRFPVDVIKLDRAFVAALRERGESAIVAGVASIAIALDLPVVAEGIEHADDVGRLQAYGYGIGQGYHFGRPQPGLALPTPPPCEAER